MLKEKEIVGLVTGEGEKSKLKKICIKYNIPITYEELFKDNNTYYLWGFNKDGIGLISTIIMRNLKTVLHGLDEFENYIKEII